jgi:hypothetical protein
MIHSHISWPRSGDCGGSRIRTRDSCVLCLVSPSWFKQLNHHIPITSHHTPITTTSASPQLQEYMHNLVFFKELKLLSQKSVLCWTSKSIWNFIFLLDGEVKTSNAKLLFFNLKQIHELPDLRFCKIFWGRGKYEKGTFQCSELSCSEMSV